MPGVAFDMMDTFLHGRSFKQSAQSLDRKDTVQCSSCDTCTIVLPKDSRVEISSSRAIAFVALIAILLLVLLKRRNTGNTSFLIRETDGNSDMGASEYRDEPIEPIS